MHLRWARPFHLLLACGLLGANAPAAKAPAAGPAQLQIDEIFAREPLTGRVPASITWSPDGRRFLYTLPGGESGPLDTHVYDARAHRDRIFFRAAANGKGARPAPEFVWSPDSRQLAFLDAGDLWVVASDGGNRRRIAADADDPQWSPDSARVAYVHASDLYAVAARGGTAVRYSRDGAPDAINGDPDWVYSEELDMHHAYRWAPDGRRIAYLHFDERPIAQFPIVDFLAPQNSVEQQRYPLAGQANGIVSLRVGTPGGASRTLYSTKAADDYIASVGWTPAGAVAANLLDRAQKRLRYVSFGSGTSTSGGRSGSAPIALITERDAKWVDFHGAPMWLHATPRCLFLSDRDGQTALYIADTKAQTVQRLTHGYAVTNIAGVDEKLHVAFVTAAYPTRRDSTVLMIPLGGGRPRPLAGGHGAHDFFMAPNARDFVRADSTFGTPPVYSVGSTLGGGLVPLAAAHLPAGRVFGSYTLSQVDTQFGKLDAWMIQPPNFNPAKQYPVIMYVYGGPAAPTTQDRWGGSTYLYHQALAQRGFVVFSIDGPGSQIDSAAAVRRLYHRLGPASLAGQLAGVQYLQSLPYIDPDRIGIWGWSFGGYETTYALTHSPGTWKVGVAVAPVTDWLYYDSIYTERYMGTSLQDPAAYRASSSIDGAANFTGRLLISHGTSDDNVHIANSVSFLQALLLKGKQVDFMVYPRKTHGISGLPQRRHLFNHMLDYWQEHL